MGHQTLKACQSGKTTLLQKNTIVQPIKNIRESVPTGSRFGTKENNWKDTEVLLGDPEVDDDPSIVGIFDNCFGIKGMTCGTMVVIGGAILVLILVLRFLR